MWLPQTRLLGYVVAPDHIATSGRPRSALPGNVRSRRPPLNFPSGQVRKSQMGADCLLGVVSFSNYNIGQMAQTLATELLKDIRI